MVNWDKILDEMNKELVGKEFIYTSKHDSATTKGVIYDVDYCLDVQLFKKPCAVGVKFFVRASEKGPVYYLNEIKIIE